MKTPFLLTFLAAASLHAGDLTTTTALQQALSTPRDGVARHQLVNNVNSGAVATVTTDGHGNATVFTPREVIYVQPSAWGGVNMFSTAPSRPICPIESP